MSKERTKFFLAAGTSRGSRGAVFGVGCPEDRGVTTQTMQQSIELHRLRFIKRDTVPYNVLYKFGVICSCSQTKYVLSGNLRVSQALVGSFPKTGHRCDIARLQLWQCPKERRKGIRSWVWFETISPLQDIDPAELRLRTKAWGEQMQLE